MNLGQKIYQLRTQKNMTLEELGQKVGVGKSTIRKWETGMIANMRRDKIAGLAKALDVDVSYFLEWEENVEKKENSDFIADFMNDSVLIEYTKKMSKLNPEHQKAVFEYINFLYEKGHH